MQITTRQAPTLMGEPLGVDRTSLTLNQKEQAAIRRAIEIREAARDALETHMGKTDWQYSEWYALSIDDLADGSIRIV